MRLWYVLLVCLVLLDSIVQCDALPLAELEFNDTTTTLSPTSIFTESPTIRYDSRFACKDFDFWDEETGFGSRTGSTVEVNRRDRCDALSNNTIACSKNNYCCYFEKTGKCQSPNFNGVECQTRDARKQCEALSNCIWLGNQCRRKCPSKINRNINSAAELCTFLSSITQRPTLSPTRKPTLKPTLFPTIAPSLNPTFPTLPPVSKSPTFAPTKNPTSMGWSDGTGFTSDSKELYPARKSFEILSEFDCRHRNYLCWSPQEKTCFPPNPSFIECVGLGRDACVALDPIYSCAWRDGACSRKSPLLAVSNKLPDDICAEYTQQRADQIERESRCFTLSGEVCAPTFDFERRGDDASSVKKTFRGCVFSEDVAPLTRKRVPPGALGEDRGKDGFFWCALSETYGAHNKGKWDFCSPECVAPNRVRKLRPRSLVMILTDDLRPDIRGGYNSKFVSTPNLDSLMSRPTSVWFHGAYASHAMCNPSRTALFTGRFSVKTRVMSQVENYRTLNQSWYFLHDAFKDNGFQVALGGKVYHVGNGPPASAYDEVFSPSQEQFDSCGPLDTSSVSVFNKHGEPVAPRIACVKRGGRDGVLDYQVARLAISRLKRYARAGNTSFFLSLGIYKPHLPLQVLRQLWAPYERKYLWKKSLDSPNPGGPVPRASFYREFFDTLEELSDFGLSASNPYVETPFEVRNLLRTAYLAACTQVDDVVGQVLGAIDQFGLRESTAVVFTSDHGYSLAESGMWGKDTLFETATRVPLIVNVPWLAASKGGMKSLRNNLYTHEDLFPTLVSLFNLNVPPPARAALDGTDLSSLVMRRIMQGKESAIVKGEAYSMVARSCQRATLAQISVFGFTLRTVGLRYTVWVRKAANDFRPDFASPILGEELFNHSRSLDLYANEHVNIAPAMCEGEVSLCALLRARIVQKFGD